MKGMELPISTIVIIIIVLVVLLAIIAFFFGVWNPGVGGISLEAAKNNACQMLISTGCNYPKDIAIEGFDANRDGKLESGRDWEFSTAYTCGEDGNDNLAALCDCWYNLLDSGTCKERLCNCE